MSKLSKQDSSLEIAGQRNFNAPNFKFKENDPTYRGEGLDPSLINGPNQTRNNTNIFCCVLFCLIIVGEVVLGISAFVEGDPERLAVPVDSDFHKCGFGEIYEKFPYVYMPFIDNQSSMNQDAFVCAQNCPFKEDMNVIFLENNQIRQENGENNFNVTFKSVKSLSTYETVQFGRACIPVKNSNINEDHFKKYHAMLTPDSSLEEGLGDLRTSWPVLVGSIFMVLVFGYLYLFVMRRFAACMTYSTILLFILALFISGGIMLAKANQLGPYKNVSQDQQKMKEQKAFAALFFILAIFISIYLFCQRAKIRLAITIMKCSIDFTRSVKRIFYLPLFMFIVYLLYLIFWIYAALFVYSAGKRKENFNEPFDYIDFDKGMRFSLFLHFIALIIISNFFNAISQFITASAASQWYFYREQQDKLQHPIRKAACQLYYHTGSLAYGSIVLYYFLFINMILKVIHTLTEGNRKKKLMERNSQIPGEQDNCCVECLIGLAYYYEGESRYITENSYTQMAISGYDFIKSSHTSYYLMLRNLASFEALGGVGSLMITMGKIFLCASTSFICYLGIAYSSQITPYLYSTVVPIVFIMITSYYMGSIFVGVYGSSADAILQCYCIDEELHNQIHRTAQFVPVTMQQFLDENSFRKKQDSKI